MAGITAFEIKKIWGIAKCPELKLSDEDLHLVVEKLTGKESIKALERREAIIVIRELQNMKESCNRGTRARRRKNGGNSATENQRKKIYKLTKDLGWDKPARVNGMCRKMFNVNAVEWLSYQQCSKLIEALKSMVARKEGEDAGLQADNKIKK